MDAQDVAQDGFAASTDGEVQAQDSGADSPGATNPCLAGGKPQFWQAIIGGAKDDVATGVAFAGDQVVIAGRTESQGQGLRDGWLAGIDPGGPGGSFTVAWDHTWGGPLNDEFNALTPWQNGFAAAGSTQKQGQERDAWLVISGPAGEPLATHQYTMPLDQELYGVAALPSGLAVTGYSEEKNGDLRLLVMLLGADGKPQWQAVLGSSDYDVGWDIAAAPDGGVVVAGESTLASPNAHLRLTRFDAAGKVMWAHTLGQDVADAGLAVKIVPGGMAVAGYRDGTTPGARQMLLLKTDAGGQVQWQQQYGSLLADAVQALAVGPGGTFLLAGSWDGAAGTSKLATVLVDASGKALWTKTHGGGGAEMAHAAATAPAGHTGWAVAGQIGQPGGKLDAWVLRIDANGTPSCAM
jgi:hypothetical protein